MKEKREKKGAIKAYSNFLNKGRWPLIAIFMILNIIAIAGVVQIKINPDMDIFMPEESSSRDIYNELGEKFGSNQQIMLALNVGESEDIKAPSDDQNKKFALVSNYLKEHKAVEFFTGPQGAVDTKNSPALKMGISPELLSDMDLTTKLLDGNLYGLFSIFPTEKFNNNEMQLMEDFLTENKLDYALTGNMFFQKKINDYISIVIIFLPIGAFLLILLTFTLQMGSIKTAILSLMPAGVGALWTFGIIGWIGKDVSIFTAIAPVFTVVIGSAAGLHFLSHFSEYINEDNDRKSAITKTLTIIGVPLIITTVTSVGGFLSLLLMNASGVSDLSTSSALGILLAGFAALTILPIVLLGKIKIKPIPHHKKMGELIFRKLRGVPAIIIAAVLLIAGVTGTFFVKTNFDQLAMFKKSTIVYENSSLIQELTGGKLPIYALIESENSNPLQKEYGDAILELENSLKEDSLIKSAFSPYSAISSIYQISQKEMMEKIQSGKMSPQQLKAMMPQMSQSQKEMVQKQMTLMRNPQKMQMMKKNGTLPEMKVEIENYPTDLVMAETLLNKITTIKPAIGHHINSEASAVRLIIFPTETDHDTLVAIRDKIEKQSADTEGLSIKVTGFDYLMDDLNVSIKPSLLKSLSAALIMIFFLMLLVLKKFLPSLISITPVMITISVLFGFLGFTGITLNLVTAAIFSITIGVGIDYAVHFSSVAKTYNDVDKAFKITSKPIIANSLGLALGMSALFFSPFAIHSQLSIMMWLTMITSMGLTLILMPTLLSKIYNKKHKEHMEIAESITHEIEEE